MFLSIFFFFFFNDTATTEIYTLSLHDALPLTRNLLVSFFLHPHYGYLGESFRERGRLEFRSHAAHNILGDNAVATLVALDANFQRDVEKYRVDLIAIIFRQFDPVLTLLRREICCVHIVHRTLGDQPRLEHGAQVREYEILKTLFANVVEQQRTHHVTGERDNTMAFEPGTLARTGQADRQHYQTFRWALGRGYRGDRQGMTGWCSESRMVPGLLLRSALRGRVRTRPERRAKSAPWAQLPWALALPLTRPRQNMQVAAEEAQTRLPGRCPFFCGAVSARASICACQAFNTETELRAISEEVTNHGR